jgi:hypothetical protein
MDSVTGRPSTLKENGPLREPVARRIPVEIWETILRAASASSLFPYIDAHDPYSRVLSSSIIENVHLFRQSICQQVAMYTRYVNRVTQLRCVCRTWSSILSHISIYHRWMITDLQFRHYPHINSTQCPDRLVIDISHSHSKSTCSNPSCAIDMKHRKKESNYSDPQVSHMAWPQMLLSRLKDAKAQTKQSPPPLHDPKRGTDNRVYLSPSALSQVTILELRLTRRRDLFDMMGFVPALRALSFDLLSIYFPFRPTEMDLGRHAMCNLTHLRLFHMGSSTLSVCYATTLHFPNIIYLGFSFKSGLDAYSEPESLVWPPSPPSTPPSEEGRWFQKWSLPKLESLCLEGEMPLTFAEHLAPFFINCGQTVSQLLLDLDWNWTDPSLGQANTLLDNMQSWFPHISTLGCGADAARRILLRDVQPHSSPGEATSYSTDHPTISTLFLLTGAFWRTQDLLADLSILLQSIKLDRVYLSASKDDVVLDPLLESIIPAEDKPAELVTSIGELCFQHGIRVFDRDGWEYHGTIS